MKPRVGFTSNPYGFAIWLPELLWLTSQADLYLRSLELRPRYRGGLSNAERQHKFRQMRKLEQIYG